jgi:hypothetical protein
MTITVESTSKMVKVNGYECRQWEGTTARGVKIIVLIPRIAVRNGQDVSQFENELNEQSAPPRDTEAFPLRMVL